MLCICKHIAKAAQARAQTKIANELAKPTQDKIVFKKFPDPSKKIKNATHNPTDNETETQY